MNVPELLQTLDSERNYVFVNPSHIVLVRKSPTSRLTEIRLSVGDPIWSSEDKFLIVKKLEALRKLEQSKL